jgi:hypothetical protein
MAITKRVRVMVWGNSDGRAGSFTFDLLTSPYLVGQAQPSGLGGRLVNWFAEKSPPGPAPTGVLAVEGAISATLAGTVVTVWVPVKPADSLHKVTLDFLFA